MKVSKIVKSGEIKNRFYLNLIYHYRADYVI
jgi:hypothetical protein